MFADRMVVAELVQDVLGADIPVSSSFRFRYRGDSGGAVGFITDRQPRGRYLPQERIWRDGGSGPEQIAGRLRVL